MKQEESYEERTRRRCFENSLALRPFAVGSYQSEETSERCPMRYRHASWVAEDVFNANRSGVTAGFCDCSLLELRWSYRKRNYFHDVEGQEIDLTVMERGYRKQLHFEKQPQRMDFWAIVWVCTEGTGCEIQGFHVAQDLDPYGAGVALGLRQFCAFYAIQPNRAECFYLAVAAREREFCVCGISDQMLSLLYQIGSEISLLFCALGRSMNGFFSSPSDQRSCGSPKNVRTVLVLAEVLGGERSPS